MNSNIRTFAMVGLSIFAAGLACQAPDVAPPGAVETSVAEALADAETETAVAGLQLTADVASGSSFSEDEATTTPNVSPTPAPPTDTPTPGVPMALLTENTHCRTGPAIIYKLVRTFNSGDSTEILGKHLSEDYWVVKDPVNPSNSCWLWGRYLETSGDIAALPIFTPPPTPGPDWSGDWAIELDTGPFSMTLSQSGSGINGSLTEGAMSYPVSGSATAGGDLVTGTLYDDTDPTLPVLNYTWQILENRDQFVGNYEEVSFPGVFFPWCGARNGASLPSPCMGP